MKQLLSGAKVFYNGRFSPLDILINNGVVSDVASSIVSQDVDEILNFNSFYILPGLADVHVHFREPGFSYKETIKTGSLAAACSGYTDVCTMPNLSPVPDSVENLKKQLEIIERDALIGVHPYGAITAGEKGEKLSDMQALAPHVIAFSDDGRGVQSEEMMLAAMAQAKRLGKIIAAHCEDNALLFGGYIHSGSYASAHGHRGICSESEYKPIERDLALAAKAGCSYHVCHISTKESVDLIRKAKAAGVDVTCETAPHYLLLTQDDLREDGRFKMNPPLRCESDRQALLDGIADGTVDIIATDHAPHSAEEKGRGLEKSAFGIVGLETALPLMYTDLVKTGIISFERLIELMSYAPAKRFGLNNDIAINKKANLTVYDFNKEYIIDPEKFKSMGHSTPFEGETVYGKCIMTICNGRIIWRDSSIEK